MTTIDQLYPDIWQEIFEYFNATELFFTFKHITRAADEVLLHRDHRFRIRGLVIDDVTINRSDKHLLSQVVSLELHQESYFDLIEHCLELRSLKLIGQSEWVTRLLKEISYTSMKLEQLLIVFPGIGSLYDLLTYIESLSSLCRLAIYANQSEERIKMDTSLVGPTKLQQFTLHSCSSLTWSKLSYLLPVLSNIRFLDITLFYDKKESFYWFTFPKLLCICLTLLEVPFEWLVQIVETMPSLTKLKLNGLIDAEGFIINHKWLNLFEFCPSLNTINVNLSLESNTFFHCIDVIQTSLREMSLSLICLDDEYNDYSNERNQHHWWSLSGIIIKPHEHI